MLNKRFMQINRNMFQNEEILNRIKNELNTKQIDVIFSVYAILEFDKNRFLTCKSTLNDIESYLYKTHQTNNIVHIREAMEILQVYDIIEFDFDIYTIKSNEMFRVSILEYKQFVQISEDDFKLLTKLGSKFFLMYCNINNFYNQKQGYSFVGYNRLSKLMSTSTISKYLNIAYCLGIYDIITIGDGWVYKEEYDKAIKSNNMYYKNIEKVNEVANMNKKAIDELIKNNINIVRTDKYKASVYRYLELNELSYTEQHKNNILNNIDCKQREEILCKLSKNKNADLEFQNALIVYYYDKFVKSESRDIMSMLFNK